MCERSALALDIHIDGTRPTGDSQPGLELVQLVLDLFPCPLSRSAHQHVGRQVRRGALAHEAFLVAEVKDDRSVDGLSARFLGKKRHLHSGGKAAQLSASLDVGRRRIEGLTRGRERFPFVAFQESGRVGRGRDLGAIGLAGGQEETDRAVGGL